MKRPIFSHIIQFAMLLQLAACGNWWLPFDESQDKPLHTEFTKSNKSAEKKLVINMAELMGRGVQQPTAEQIQEEKQVEQEQVETAVEWLHDTDSEQRLIGAEQLSAYPTLEAEKNLRKSLLGDFDSRVRAAAARSLGAFKVLTPQTQTALFKALQDEDNVAQNSLDVLMHHFLIQEANTKKHRNLANAFLKQSHNKHLSKVIQEALQNFLLDQGIR